MVKKTGGAAAPKAKTTAKAKAPAKPASPKWGKGKKAADAAGVPVADETPQNISTGEERVDPNAGMYMPKYQMTDPGPSPGSETLDQYTPQQDDQPTNIPNAGPADDPPPETPAPKPTAPPERMGGNATGVLISSVERLERLMEERDAIGDDIKEVLGELKEVGYNTGIVRKVLSRRRMDPAKRDEQDTLLETYEFALEKRQ